MKILIRKSLVHKKCIRKFRAISLYISFIFRIIFTLFHSQKKSRINPADLFCKNLLQNLNPPSPSVQSSPSCSEHSPLFRSLSTFKKSYTPHCFSVTSEDLIAFICYSPSNWSSSHIKPYIIPFSHKLPPSFLFLSFLWFLFLCTFFFHLAIDIYLFHSYTKTVLVPY